MGEEMSSPDHSAGTDTSVAFRDQLTNLEALLALSLRMTDTVDEAAILRLAGTAIPSLCRCRLLGVHLVDDGWCLTRDEAVDARCWVDVEMQLTALGITGGPIVVEHERWG